MSQLELVNPIDAGAIPAWTRSMLTTFLGDRHSSDAERRIGILKRGWDPARAWGAREGRQWVGTLRTEARSLTIPGSAAAPEPAARTIGVDAVTNVTVAATHRRRGIMREMLAASLCAARERGDAISALIAAEWPIYGRFGYAPACLSTELTLLPDRLAPPGFGDPSKLRQVELSELPALVPGIFEASRLRDAGQMDRAAGWWARVLGEDGFPPASELPPNWLVHEGENGPDGYVAWRPEGSFSLARPAGRAEVWELVAASEEAYRDLWAYLAGLDSVRDVRLSLRPVDEPIRWLLSDGRALVTTQLSDFVWLRLLDVPAALSARGYACGGDFVLEVHDEAGGPGGGRFRLHVGPDGEAACEPTRDAADLEISQRVLAASYLGGFHLSRVLLGSGLRELKPGVLAMADAMFATPKAPWNATWF